MKTKPFNIEEAKAGAKVVTRAGEPVRIVCFDGRASNCSLLQPIIHDCGRTYTSKGSFLSLRECDQDLLLISEPKLRPWKPEEVPVGCAIRKKADRSCWAIITACLDNKPKLGLLGSYDCNPFENFKDEFEQFEWKHLHESETAWKPCGVEE